VLGRDWFRLCSTGLEDNPDAAVRLPTLNQWFFFAASPVNAIHSTQSFLSSKLQFFWGGCFSESLTSV
jgi:hypothetical protein